MSFWPFAISLVLLIAMIFMWFSVAGERDQALGQARTAREKETAAAENLDKLRADFMAVSKLVGFMEGTNYSSAKAIEARMASAVAAWREKATMDIATSKYTAAEGGGTIEKAEGDKVKVVYLGAEGTGQPTTLEAIFPFAEQGLARFNFDVQRAFTQVAQVQEAKDAMSKAHDESLKAKDERITALGSEKSAVESQAAAQTQELRDQKAELERQKDQLQSELEQARKQATDAAAKFLTEINEAKGQIRTLVQREAPALSEGPDGEVLVGHDGLVVINRGKSHFLMPGTVFTVLGRAKGGATYPKGTVKVTMCDDESARCTVLDQADGMDPIAQGDLVQSVTYSPSRKLHFVLVGEFRKMGRSMVETRLKQLGAIVDDRVTTETHYVVEGAPGAGQESLEDTDAVKSAKEFGIRILTEEQLASFTRI
jgi:NAD-dependent DNA ligase